MAKTSVLFVCMGNICRSPSAEAVFNSIIRERGVSDQFDVDSAGTIGYHAGDLADSRMRSAASRRGIELTSRARQIVRADLDNFDYVVAMDKDNLFHIHSMDPDGRYESKIKLLTDYHPDKEVTEVPDPYYGGPDGFETVLDILEVSCEKFLEAIEETRAG